MDNLRVTLMVIALLVFAGVFFWSTRSEKQGGASLNSRRSDSDEPPLSDLGDDEPEVEPIRMTHADEATDDGQDYLYEPMIKTEADDETLSGTQAAFPFDELAHVSVEETDPPPASEANTDTTASVARPEKEILLLIGLMSDSEEGFSGPDVQAALREVGLEHGEMNIFHHFGVGLNPDKDPLFSLANMFEPGDFDPAQLEQALSSKGYVLFMRGEGKRDDRVSLELMLNTANRLAAMLGAEVMDRARQPLREETIEQMRAQLSHA